MNNPMTQGSSPTNSQVNQTKQSSSMRKFEFTLR